MLYIKNIEEGRKVFNALGSELRIEIIKLLIEHTEMNMNELASSLGVTNGALTSHIRKLEDSGIIRVITEHNGHGNQKICRVNIDRLLVDIAPKQSDDGKNTYTTDIKVGCFSDYQILPTCGLASNRAIVGEVDDPRYFAHPDRFKADIVWFTKGYVEYMIPNMVPPHRQIDQVTISLELGSEAPGINSDWPSDITICINNVEVGMWTSPGDFGDVQGIFTPDWWFPNWNQYGLLKMIVVNQSGTFMDGLKISGVTIEDLNLGRRNPLKLKFEVKEDAANAGGLTIFGCNFGNYNQDIKVRVHYSPVKNENE
ncbi:ArsR/SmtB family transcription factor [Lacrimispora sp.]|jgi:predicted transcriptional regulator|uniref:ArsR/SmtB family transcription factor n=1 Tax=Lacrimispora sp. TaxID=2719234 RepID=UPI0028A8ED9C|nr:winged helix-turn-helix transcriptional regulator [Lacrimispora sp.]